MNQLTNGTFSIFSVDNSMTVRTKFNGIFSFSQDTTMRAALFIKIENKLALAAYAQMTFRTFTI